MPKLTESATQRFSLLVQLLERRILRPFYTRSRYGLSPLQINVLLLLDRDASPSMSDIAAHLDISKPNVTPIVDKLIAGGYAVRFANPDDRRIINICATDEGKKLIRNIRGDMKKSLEERFEDCDEAQFKEFMDALSTCITFLSKLGEN